MPYDEFTILEFSDAIRERRKWELCCEGCKHLGDATWHLADRTGKTHYCKHPNRQSGFSDPRPYGCGGHCYEK